MYFRTSWTSLTFLTPCVGVAVFGLHLLTPLLQMGVLTINLGNRGSYVINKQTPNRQVWWSSPIRCAHSRSRRRSGSGLTPPAVSRSGPKRYEYSDEVGEWVSTRDSSPLLPRLRDELRKLTGVDLELRGEVSE